MGKTSTLLPAIAALLFISACSGDPASSITSASGPIQVSADANGNPGLTLHPNGFGRDTYSAWKAGEGEEDSRGSARMALYFQKFAPITEFVAAVARIQGLEGRPLSAIQSLSWEHRDDTWCGAGAPRWNIIVADENGNRGVIFLGCAAAVHTPGQEAGWTKDTQPGAAGIAAAPVFPFGPDFELGGPFTISDLQIVFDEGAPFPGFVYLDNIEVNGKVWTSPADNGRN